MNEDESGVLPSEADHSAGPTRREVVRDVDAVVVGGGPAGAVAARGLARSGATVVLVERAEMHRWKVCGACVGPVALAALRDTGLGDLPRDAGAVPLGRLRLHGLGGGTADVPLSGSVAWSRTDMDAALLGEARRASVEVWTRALARIGPVEAGRRLVSVRRGSTDEILRACVVLDAAGLGGAPATEAGPATDERVGRRPRIGLGAVMGDARIESLAGRTPGAAGAVSAGLVHMVVGRAGYVGLVRLEDGTVDVAAAVDPAEVRRHGAEGAVRAVLADAGRTLMGERIRGWKGTPALTRAPLRAAEERLLRIGDAMGYVEPFTGEGMGWALAAAAAVAPVALSGIRRWNGAVERAWTSYRARQERGRRVCRAVAWGLRRPLLTRGVVTLLAIAPGVARPIVRRVGRRSGVASRAMAPVAGA